MNPLFPFRTRLNLVTLGDVQEFVRICSQFDFPIYLEDGKDFRVSAKSMLGAMAALEWDNLEVASTDDIYQAIERFAK